MVGKVRDDSGGSRRPFAESALALVVARDVSLAGYSKGMAQIDHREFITSLSGVLAAQDWSRLGEFLAEDASLEFPQSGERFEGLANIRAQFENYPGMDQAVAADLQLADVVGGSQYALTAAYTLIAIDGSGTSGTFLARVRYPDQSRWWIVNLYELRDGRLARWRMFFAPEFEPPEWREPFRTPSVV